ncbi:hypothetical protein DM01DRAFT_1379183 [Hesseltinella vesiculosa]|uniref:Uncharacterized protein n=1 Tax=Hesseltinella vesiculosa TaxID=101127 RepID=A0A1X2G248_9FUNG|nr:hypothetical protein DM01DRAFT_1379183 [Hesseltinella vesiculosa]
MNKTVTVEIPNAVVGVASLASKCWCTALILLATACLLPIGGDYFSLPVFVVTQSNTTANPTNMASATWQRNRPNHATRRRRH